MTRERDGEVVSSKPSIHFLPFWGQTDWGMEMLQKRKRAINLVKSSCEQLVLELLTKKKKKSTYIYQQESLYLWNPFSKMYLIHLGFPGGSEGKESVCNAGDLGSISGSGRSPGEGNGYPLQYSCLENPMDRGAWQVQSVGSQRVRHSRATNFHFFFPPPNLSSMDHLSLTNLESLDL